jgi:hypothetical protein
MTAQTRGLGMETHDTQWVVRLTPLAGSSVHDLLRLPLSMDVWERSNEGLIVAIGETQLAEITRRSLAHVERLYTVVEYERRARQREEPRE